ncbi:MAG: hypothetical protein ACRDQ5_02650 [Sciscionella sp.]
MKATIGICCSAAKLRMPATNASVIGWSGAVEAIGQPNWPRR